jgi:tetratricopeptide (TPR) repeat protein
MGSETAAEEFVNLALNTPDATRNVRNFLTRISFFASLNRYERVLQLIDAAPEEFQRQRLSLILRAISLNRLRKHDDSEAALTALCETAPTSEELSLLVSYRIVGRIHANDIVGARNLAETYEPMVRHAKNYGYFLRNAADALDYAPATEMLTAAVALLEADDRFGWATSLSNRSTKLVALDRREEALRDAASARDTLETFGTHHLAIATANVGHALLYLRQFADAIAMQERALRYTRPGFVQGYILINLAAAKLHSGKRHEACDLIDGVSENARASPVDRLRQKAYLNAALIHLGAGSSSAVVRRYCSLALASPDRRDPEFTRLRVAFILSKINQHDALTPDEFFAKLSPCGLLYWYQNPLSGLPRYLLTVETEPQDLGHEFTM